VCLLGMFLSALSAMLADTELDGKDQPVLELQSFIGLLPEHAER